MKETYIFFTRETNFYYRKKILLNIKKKFPFSNKRVENVNCFHLQVSFIFDTYIIYLTFEY